MRWCRVVFSLVVLVSLVVSGAAQAYAGDASSQPIVLDVRTPAYTLDASGVAVPGYGRIDTPGAPALPMWTTAVELPPSGDWQLRADLPVATVDPATFAMTYLNERIDIQVTGQADGRFDPSDLVVFYAEPYQGRYMA